MLLVIDHRYDESKSPEENYKHFMEEFRKNLIKIGYTKEDLENTFNSCFHKNEYVVLRYGEKLKELVKAKVIKFPITNKDLAFVKWIEHSKESKEPRMFYYTSMRDLPYKADLEEPMSSDEIDKLEKSNCENILDFTYTRKSYDIGITEEDLDKVDDIKTIDMVSVQKINYQGSNPFSSNYIPLGSNIISRDEIQLRQLEEQVRSSYNLGANTENIDLGNLDYEIKKVLMQESVAKSVNSEQQHFNDPLELLANHFMNYDNADEEMALQRAIMLLTQVGLINQPTQQLIQYNQPTYSYNGLYQPVYERG